MRLLLVSQEYPPETAHGGIGTQTHLKAQGLVSRGHEVTVLSHSIDGRYQDLRDGRVRVVRVPGFDDRLSLHTEIARWVTYSAVAAGAIAQLNHERPFDLIEFPEWGSEGYVHLLNRSPWDRVPVVIQLHGPLVMFAHALGWPERDSEFYRVGSHMEGTCLRLADSVYSSSRCSIEWCQRHHGLDPDRIPVLHTGVDTRHFRPRDADRDRPTIVFVGKIARNKGVDLLLVAASRLAAEFPKLRLRLLGGGEATLLDELRRRAADSPGLLELPGFIDHRDLPAELSAAHLFAAPSAYEGGPGFVYLEAMACGLPVIACGGSGATEVVQHEVNGLLVPPGDVDALTAALRCLLADPEKRVAMGRRARRFVEQEADSQVQLSRLESYYLGVVDRHPSP
jgi:glycosyltransferase involved in cell wall biosynthesis